MEEKKPKREFVATVYIVKDGKVLLNKNKKLQKFIPVGGHVESDELPCETAVREAKEESGFDVEIINPDLGKPCGKEVRCREHAERKYLPQNLGIGLDIIKPNHHHINIFYIGKITGGQQLERADDDTELRWFSPEELQNCSDVLENVKEEGLKSISIASSRK